MQEQTAQPPEQSTDKVVFPANLPLSKAVEAHKDALEVVEAAKHALHIDLDGDDPSACALQLLIATKRTADAESLELTFSDSAKAVLEQFDMT